METKALIRKRMLEIREGMTVKERREKSRIIAGKLMEHPAYREAACILSYVTYRSEVDTLILMEHALKMEKKVYCPKVHGKEMEFYRIMSLETLEEGYRGIKEPPAYEEMLFTGGMAEKERCLMLMPGSAFDKDRNRIGYGGGYYDRYLERHTGLKTIAICFERQVSESIPSNSYDRKPDILLTEWHTYQEKNLS